MLGQADQEPGRDRIELTHVPKPCSHCASLGLGAASIADRAATAGAFIDDHPDLDAWMSLPLPQRLNQLEREPRAWPLIAFAAFTDRVHADFDLLAVRHVGRSFGPAMTALFPHDIADLRAAAMRLDWREQWMAAVHGNGLPLSVAATDHAPRRLSSADLDAVRAAVSAARTTGQRPSAGGEVTCTARPGCCSTPA